MYTLPLVNADATRVVQHDVQTEARRNPVSRGVAHVSRSEALVGQRRDVALDQDFRLAIRGNRIQRSILVAEGVAAGAIGAARRREDEALDAGSLGQPRQPHRCDVVDLVGQPRIQIAERIIRQRRQMDHGVEAGEISLRQVANVFANFRDRGRRSAEVATREPVGVHAHHVVTRLAKHGGGNGADITFMSSQQYSHKSVHPQAVKVLRIVERLFLFRLIGHQRQQAVLAKHFGGVTNDGEGQVGAFGNVQQAVLAIGEIQHP